MGPAGPRTGGLIREEIEAARQDAAEADEQSATRLATAEQRERTTVRAVLVGLVVVVLLLGGGLVAALLIATDAGERAAQAEARRQDADIRAVAAQLSRPVAEAVLADGRAQSARTYRAELDKANRRLLALGLPVVATPPPEATAAQVQVQAIRASVLADLSSADVLARALREQYRGVNTFPALAGLDPSLPATDGDITVTVLPDQPGGFGVDSPQPDEDDPRGRPPSSDDGDNGGGGNVAPRPAPVPAPTRPAPRLNLPDPLPDLPLPRLPLL